MFTLWKHILKAHFAPFLFSLVVLMFIFMLQFIMKFLDQLAGKGLSAAVIVEFVALNLAWMLVLAVPMSVLVSTLMAFGSLSSSNEITAIRASGVSLYRMMTPVVLVSVLLCLWLTRFNNDVLPDANHRAKALTTDIYRKKPTISLVPGLFSQDLAGYSILVRKTFEATNDMEGVTIFDYTRTDKTTTITARRGTISFSQDYRKLIMDLFDGEIHELTTTDFKMYRKIRFQKHRIAMNAEGFSFQRSQESTFSRGDRELSAQVMQLFVDSLQVLKREAEARIKSMIVQSATSVFDSTRLPATSQAPLPEPGISAANRIASLTNMVRPELERIQYLDRQSREYTVEIHKKYALPVACIVFVFIGAPLGIMARRGTFGTAASLSLGFFLMYWVCLIGGERLGDRGIIQPWLGMWLANIIIGSLGLYLTIRSARENLTIDWTKLSSVIPKRWRSDIQPAGAE